MRIEIEIPKEFELDYIGDKFKDFFSRVLCDIEKGKCLCGNYEIETVEMFIKAFDESKPAYDVEKVEAEVLEITERIFNYCEEIDLNIPEEERSGYNMLSDIRRLRECVRNGGKE